MLHNKPVRRLQGSALCVFAAALLMTGCTQAEPADPSMYEQLQSLPVLEMCNEVMEAIDGGATSDVSTNTVTVGEGFILLDKCMKNLPLEAVGYSPYEQLLYGATAVVYKAQVSATASFAKICETIGPVTGPDPTDCSRYLNNHYVVVLGEE